MEAIISLFKSESIASSDNVKIRVRNSVKAALSLSVGSRIQGCSIRGAHTATLLLKVSPIEAPNKNQLGIGPKISITIKQNPLTL